jgi:hypothetical protein
MRRTSSSRYFLPYGLYPGWAWFWPANGDGAALPFFLFLSCFGFFFSLFDRIWPLAMASSRCDFANRTLSQLPCTTRWSLSFFTTPDLRAVVMATSTVHASPHL